MRLLVARAWCKDCKWEYEGLNAMGLAAKHSKKYDHRTDVELYYSQHFPQEKSKS